MPSILIVGGLTVDRFPDGSTAPGGSVLHAGLAAAAEGARVTTLTVAGDEPAALDGLRRLEDLGPVHRRAAEASATYGHHERAGRRILVYEAATEPIHPPHEPPAPTDVLLLAPIADELPSQTIDAVRAAVAPRVVVYLIQGWLRRLVVGEPVHPLSLDEVPEGAWARFRDAAAVVVSTEDLAEEEVDPFAQAAMLRRRLGSHPILVLTLGSEGYLLDDPGAERVVASIPRRVVTDVPTVGAGDTFGAALAIRLGAGVSPQAAADAATERVIAVLEGRRS